MRLGRKVILYLLLLVLMLPLEAMATTVEEWNLSCRVKTAGTTTVYSLADKTKAVGTIPANTYCKISASVNGWADIGYMTSDGIRRSGQVHRDDLTSAVIDIRLPDGTVTDVHELLYGGKNGSSSSPNTGGKSASSQKKSNEKKPAGNGPEEMDGKDVAIFYAPSNAQASSVTVKTLGIAFSTVTCDGKAQKVATSDLTFNSNAPEDKKLAVIYAARTGKASLRKGTYGTSNVLKQCKAGRVVFVLEYGKEYCKVSYDNTVGYVLTDCLQFHAAGGETVGAGKLSYNGKTTGGTTINIRLEAKVGSRKIGEFKTGTEVTVIRRGEEWFEIEVDGIRGFVMAKYLMATE